MIGPLFAQADAAPPAGGQPGAGEQQPFWISLMMWIPLGLLFYLFFMRPAQKQAAQQRDQLDSLKKGDRLVTKAGIYGSVVSVDKEAKKITLKIDESNNTKIDITLSSVDYLVGVPGDNAKST
ncbi:MAG: preprotein translocase subunit YajC [Pirellulales bacterium]